jgi:hypothetical protein
VTVRVDADIHMCGAQRSMTALGFVTPVWIHRYSVKLSIASMAIEGTGDDDDDLSLPDSYVQCSLVDGKIIV